MKAGKLNGSPQLHFRPGVEATTELRTVLAPE